MKKVDYYLNSIHLRSNKVFISKSEGLFGLPKPKQLETYSWAEYHGEVLVKNSKQYFEPREITLTGWVEGANWLNVVQNFEKFIGEFRKAGKQRLVIKPFGVKDLVYDVILNGEADLEKTFKDGFMVGTFTIKLKELSPIKKVLKMNSTTASLKFTTTDWVQVCVNGVITNEKGTINKTYTANPSYKDELNATNNYVIISGDLAKISNFTATNAVILWNEF